MWKPWAGGGWQCENLGFLVGRVGGWVVWLSEGVWMMRYLVRVNRTLLLGFCLLFVLIIRQSVRKEVIGSLSPLYLFGSHSCSLLTGTNARLKSMMFDSSLVLHLPHHFYLSPCHISWCLWVRISH